MSVKGDIDSTGRYVGLGSTAPGSVGDWQKDERGIWFVLQPNGSRRYNAPTLAEQKVSRPGDSFFRDTVWDDKTGTWKKKTNWNNILALAAGSAVGAGAINGAMAGGGAVTTAGAPAVNFGAAPSASGLFAPTGLVGTTAPAATTAASTGAGAGMKFGAGTLANFFNSRGGAEAINAAGQLIGGKMQASAANHAADLQAQAAREALDFAKAQYAQAQKDYAPFLQASQNAVPQLTDFMGQMRPPQGGYPVNGSAPGAPAGQGGAPKFVMMRSPTGETRAVMPESVPKYLGRGMTVVG